MSQYKRILEPRSVTANLSPELNEAFDAGAFNNLQFDCRILKVGTGAGNVLIEHAAVNEPDAFRPLAGIAWPVVGNGGFLSCHDFLRFIRWRGDSNITAPPTAMIDLIAKE